MAKSIALGFAATVLTLVIYYVRITTRHSPHAVGLALVKAETIGSWVFWMTLAAAFALTFGLSLLWAKN